MEPVPPDSEKMTKFTEDSNIPNKKVKVQVRACHTLNIFCLVTAKNEGLTSTFTFPVGFFDSFDELSQFSLLGGTSSILKTFLGGTSQKNHPV